MSGVNLRLGRFSRAKWLILGSVPLLAVLLGLLAVISRPKSRVVWTLPYYVSEASFSQDGHSLIAAAFLGHSSLLTVWDSSTGKEIKERAFDKPFAFAVSPDESKISVLMEPGTLVAINASTLEIEKVTDIADSQVYSFHNIRYSPTGKYLCITGVERGRSSMGFARIYDTKTGRLLVSIEWPEGWYQMPIAFNPDGTRLAIGTSPTDDEGILRVWDTSSWKEVLNATSDAAITSLAWSLDGTSIAMGSLSRRVDVFRSTSLDKIFSIKAEGAINSLVYSPNSCFIIFSGSYVSAQVWESRSGKQVANLGYGSGIDLSLTLSPKGDLALLSDYNFLDRPSKSTSALWDISDYLKCNSS